MLHSTAVTKQWTEIGFISQMLFSALYKIIVNKVTFLGFRGAGSIAPIGLPAETWNLRDRDSQKWVPRGVSSRDSTDE